MSYRAISHLTFPVAAALPTYPPGYPTESIATVPSADTTDKPWRMVGHEHASINVSGGRLRIPDYQSEGSFSNGVLQCVSPGSDFAVTGDFLLEFTHNTKNHNHYVSSSPCGMVTAVASSSYGIDSVGDWHIENFYSNGSRGIQFALKTALDVVTGYNVASVRTPSDFAQLQNVDYVVRVERVAGVLTLKIDGALVGTQLAHFGSHPLAAIAPTLGGYGNGGHYLPNNYATGEYANFFFGRLAIPLVYPSALPNVSAAPLRSAERRALAPADGPIEARALQRDRLAIQDITLPPMTANEAEDFVEWGESTLVKWSAWFSATWPLPEGFVVAVRRWLKPPSARMVGGFWVFSAPTEVRGRGALPRD